MNTLFHSLVENKREKDNIASVSKIEAQNYLCPVQHVCWTRLLRLARFYYDSLGTLTPLEIAPLGRFALLDNFSWPGSFAWLTTFICSEHDLPVPSSAGSFGSAALLRSTLL